MTPEKTIEIKAKLADQYDSQLATSVARFVALLDRCTSDPDSCPDERILPYLEPYRLLKGNHDEVAQFIAVLMDVSDPRHEAYEFVLDMCEAHNVHTAIFSRKLTEEFA